MLPVGVTTVELVDPSRTDLSGATRRLMAEIWCPAVPAAFFNRSLRDSGAAAGPLDADRLPADSARLVEYRQTGIAP